MNTCFKFYYKFFFLIKVRGRISPASMSRADSVGSLEFRTASILGTSRGPSPLTIGMTDTIPLAVAFHEIIHAYFRYILFKIKKTSK